MLTCPKCHNQFRKQHRYDAHISKVCPGKVCRNCGAIGHLACGISISGEELKKRIQKAAAEGKPIRVVGLF